VVPPLIALTVLLVLLLQAYAPISGETAAWSPMRSAPTVARVASEKAPEPADTLGDEQVLTAVAGSAARGDAALPATLLTPPTVAEAAPSFIEWVPIIMGEAALVAAAPRYSKLSSSSRSFLNTGFAERQRRRSREPEPRAWFDGGVYHFAVQDPAEQIVNGAPIVELLGDMTVRPSCQSNDGSHREAHGLLAWDQGQASRDRVNLIWQQYVFEVADHGEISVWRGDENGRTNTVCWSPSEAVRPTDVEPWPAI